MAEFEFVALACIKQQELGRDEIIIEYAGKQVFPAPGNHMKFDRGTVLVNEGSTAEMAKLRPLLTAAGAVRVHDYPGVENFLRCPVPVTGLAIRVVEQDWPMSRNDIIGNLLISGVDTLGVRTAELTGAGAHYRLHYRVVDATMLPKIS